AEDRIRDFHVTGVQTCALPISSTRAGSLWLPARSTDDTQTSTGSPETPYRLPMFHRAVPAGMISVVHEPSVQRACTTSCRTGSPPGARTVRPRPLRAADGGAGGSSSSHGIAGV